MKNESTIRLIPLNNRTIIGKDMAFAGSHIFLTLYIAHPKIEDTPENLRNFV